MNTSHHARALLAAAPIPVGRRRNSIIATTAAAS